MADYTARIPAAAIPKKFLSALRLYSRGQGSCQLRSSLPEGFSKQSITHIAERLTAADDPSAVLVPVHPGRSLGARPPLPTRGSVQFQTQRSTQHDGSYSQATCRLLTQRSGILSSRQSSAKLSALMGDSPIDSVEEGPGRIRGSGIRRMSSMVKGSFIENSQMVTSHQHCIESSSRTHQTPSLYYSAKEPTGRSNNFSKYVLQTPKPEGPAKEISRMSAELKEEIATPSKVSHQSSRLSVKSPQKDNLSAISEKSGQRLVSCPWKRQQQAQPGIRTEDIMHAFVADL